MQYANESRNQHCRNGHRPLLAKQQQCATPHGGLSQVLAQRKSSLYKTWQIRLANTQSGDLAPVSIAVD